MIYIQLILIIIYCFTLFCIRTKIVRFLVSFYVLLLSFQLILAELDIYDVHSISYNTFICFNLSIFFFIVGVFLGLQKYKTKVHENNSMFSFDKLKLTNVNLILCVNICMLLLEYYYYLRMKALMATLLFTSDARGLFYKSDEFFSSYTDRLCYLHLVFNYSYICSFLFGYFFLVCKDKTWKEYLIIYTSLLYVVLGTFVSLGRGVLVPLVVVNIFFCFFVRIYKPLLLKGVIKKIVFVCFIMLIPFLGVSYLRANIDSGGSLTISEQFESMILEPIVTYFSNPVISFDYGKQFIFNNEGLWLGKALFSGLLNLISLPFIFISPVFKVTSIDVLNEYTVPFYTIYGTYDWNALYTIGFNYYLDFGTLGFIIYPLIIGYVFCRIICWSIRTNTPYAVIVLFVYFFFLLRTVQVSPFTDNFWSLFVFLYFMRKKILSV